MARPKKPSALTAEQVEQLAMLGLSDDDIALVAGLGERTLQTRFGAQLKAGRAQKRQKLLAYLWSHAERSPGAAIWLSQQWLGMRHAASRHDDDGEVTVRIVHDRDDDLEPRT